MIQRLFAYLRNGSVHERRRTLIASLVDILPDNLKAARKFARIARCHGWEDSVSTLGYAFISWSYRDLPDDVTERGTDLMITGAQVASVFGTSPVPVDLFVRDGRLQGVRITNGDYELLRLDPKKVLVGELVFIPHAFPPTEAELFIEGLDQEVRSLLELHDIMELDMNGRAYFTFHDLEDGNFLALDKNLQVWSLVHDAKPMAKLMKTDLKQLLLDIKQGRFSAAEHLEARYAE